MSTKTNKFDYSGKNSWKRPLKNAKKLLWGEFGKSFFTLGTIALSARALGVADFGALTILTTTLAIITQFVTFSSWQLVLHYGAKAFQENNADAYKHIVQFALILEVLASVCGAIILFSMTDFLIQLFQLPQSVAPLLPWLGILLIFTSISGIADGTLRLTDRFNIISAINVVPKALKFFIVVYLFWGGYGLNAFILAMFVTSGFSSVMRLFIAARYFIKDLRTIKTTQEEQSRAGLTVKPWQKGKFFSPQKGTWKFSFGLYADSCMGMGNQQLGGVFLGALIGPEGAGIYRIAEKISMIIASPVNKLLLPAVFTDMAFLNAQKNYTATKQMIFKLGTMTGTAAIAALAILVFIGKPLIILMAGEDYVSAYVPMLVLVLNITLWAATFTLYPLITTSGNMRYVVVGRSVMFALYVSLMVPFVHTYGVLGAALSATLSSFLATAIPISGAYKIMAKRRQESQDGEHAAETAS